MSSYGTVTSKVDEDGSSQPDPHKNGTPLHSPLEFQDCALSPSLALSPTKPDMTEYSLLQKSDAEFMPLSACPDYSAIHEDDESSLSQYPLDQETVTTLREADLVAEATSVNVSSGSSDTLPDAVSGLPYQELTLQGSKSSVETSSATGLERDDDDGDDEESSHGLLPHSQSTPGVLSSKSTIKSETLPTLTSNNQEVDHANSCSDLLVVSDTSSSIKLGSEVPSSKSTAFPTQAHLNIEDRNPLYLQNLGIHRSPAEILTPFGPSGPIREPEFSPTDLSTIKDSAGGTPTKSTQSSHAGSPSKGDLSDGIASSASGHHGSLLTALPLEGTATATLSTNSISPELPSSHSNHSSNLSNQQTLSSLLPVQSEEPRESSSSVKVTVVSEDPVSPMRAEPEGCSAGPRLPLTTGPSSALDVGESHVLPDEPLPPADHEMALDVSDHQSVMSERSVESSLTLRVEELLRAQSPPAGVSDPKNKKKFIFNLSEGQFDSLELGKEDRQRVEEIKAAMHANNFVTSESSTDTESTMASGVAENIPLDLTKADQAHHVREKTSTNVKEPTSITNGARKRPDKPSLAGPPLLEVGCIPSISRKSPMEEEREMATEAESDDPSNRPNIAEDTTIPLNHVSRTRLTPLPKPVPLGRSPSSSSSSGTQASLEPPADMFVPLKRSSPVVSSADEGVGLSGPLPERDLQSQPISSSQRQSFRGKTMRSYTPETPVRDEGNDRAVALRPYKPRGANELFFMPEVEGRGPVSSSCTTMESSHTGLDDAVPPVFAPEVLGQCDAGLDRGVTIKHSRGIYSKKSSNAKATRYPGATVAFDEKHFQASQRETSVKAGFQVGGGATNTQVEQLPLLHADREAWLLEQLQRLSNLILATRGDNVPHYGRHYNENQTWIPRPRTLCPADRDESSTTTSTLDTDRLIRAFGTNRGHGTKNIKTPARLRKLYGDVAKQRERWEERGFRDIVAEASDVTGESSAAGCYTQTPRVSTSRMAVNRGSQAADVEVKHDVTRLHTRDVGTMFPPRPGHTQRSLNSAKHKKMTVLPRQPKAVWWFIPLQNDDFKENRPELEKEGAEPEQSTMWYHSNDIENPTRETLRPQQDKNDDDVLPESSHEVNPLPESSLEVNPLPESSHEVNPLQDALAARRADFILKSQRRTEILSLRRINGTLPGSVGLRRAVPWKEMIQRTKRMYERLPEVLHKMECEVREKQMQLNRLNLQIYNKRMNKHRLEKQDTLRHQYL
ncbi:uncharacterized protein LOC144206053 isoform X1 [Stigmatopora nigra]